MDLIDKITLCHQENLTREETFRRLCSERNLPSLSAEQITQHFKALDDGLPKSADFNHRYLLHHIYLTFGKIQNTISDLSANPNIIFCLLNSRYVLTMCIVKGHANLNLLDIYHGQTKQIRIIGITSRRYNFYSMNILDSGHLLLYTHEESYFYLMRLDLSNLECILLDLRILGGDLYKLIFDCKNRQQFVILYHSVNFKMLKRGHIEESKLIFDGLTLDRDYDVLRCERLKGDRLQVFTTNGQNIEFGEYDLSGLVQRRTFQKLFDLETTSEIDMNLVYEHVWCNNICIFGDSEFKLYAFDFDTRKICQIKCFLRNFTIFDMNLEEDILTMCVNNEDNHNFAWRLALKQPDKLEHLSLFRLRKAAIFNKSPVYDQIAPMFPPDLQPFPP